MLGYHRVDVDPRDPYGLRVSPGHFEEHLEVLRRWARPVSLSHLARGLREGHVPESAVAVTFDDGYAGLMTEAVPRLARYDVPATVFVVTDMLGREPWWDILARAALDGDLSSHYRRLAGLPPSERNKEMDRLIRRSGTERGSSAGSGALRLLGPEEVRRMAGDGRVEVGAHSATHPDLTALEDGGREEIERSVARVRELIGGPVLSFSYPHGRTSSRVRESVRRAGPLCACTSRNDVVRRGSDPYRLPRFWPGDWNGDRFARWLRRWLGR